MLPRNLCLVEGNRSQGDRRSPRAFRHSRCDGSSRRRKGSWHRRHLRGERDSPEKRQRGAKSDDAKRGYAFRREAAKMSALQNRRIKRPDGNGGHHLHARQWSPGKKPAHNPKCIKGKTQPKQSRDGRKKIGQRREMIKNGMQLMRLELAFLHEIHHARNAREREGTVG